MTQREAVIVEAVRTAMGRRGGRLKDWHPVDLLAQTLTALIQRTGIDPGSIDDVIIGCVGQRVGPPSRCASHGRGTFREPDCARRSEEGGWLDQYLRAGRGYPQ